MSSSSQGQLPTYHSKGIENYDILLLCNVMQIDEVVVQMKKEFGGKQTKSFVWERVLRRKEHFTVSNSLKSNRSIAIYTGNH